MALTNAEKQKRHRERLKAKAALADRLQKEANVGYVTRETALAAVRRAMEVAVAEAEERIREEPDYLDEGLSFHETALGWTSEIADAITALEDADADVANM